MPKRSKRYRAAAAKIEAGRLYDVDEGLGLVKDLPVTAFDETVLASVRLGVNPTKGDQVVRGAVVLPAGLGVSKRVAVFAEGEKVKEAEEAGADLVGVDELIEQVEQGKIEFDTAIATPDVMGKVAKVAKVLGPRGLMPNPKTGTVTFDVKTAVEEAKAGRVEYRVDKGSNIHAPIGKRSFDTDALRKNLDALLESLVRAKPSAAKGVYLRTMHVSPAMGPSVALDPSPYRR